ncbi:FLYWCH zinc finger domain-containing protein [Phthorimaea operculella]|nr:FLYWCH zinc finger domain-containing protein [Phthorimaea operculella]
MTARGNPMILLGNYKFLEHSTNKSRGGLKKRWSCSMINRCRCRAFLITIENEIIRHQKEPVFTMSSHGNPIIQIGRYKFGAQNKQSSHGSKKRWACSKRSGGCRAYLVTLDNEIILYRNQHNH